MELKTQKLSFYTFIYMLLIYYQLSSSYHYLDELMNLDDFISMSPKIGEGVVKDLSGFVEYFDAKLPGWSPKLTDGDVVM